MSELLIAIITNLLLGLLLLSILYWKRAADDAALGGSAQAIELFRLHFPDAAGIAVVAADHRSALIDLERVEGVGLLQRRGRRWIARILAPGDVASVTLGDDGSLDLRLRDFGWPRARLHIADAAVRALWLGRLNVLTVQGASRHRRDPYHA